MTDEELKDLVAANSRAVAANSRAVAANSRAIREMREDSERRWEESERRWEKSERRWEESERQWKKCHEEILASRRETDRLITDFNRRLGETGNALGLYTESMFQPSLKRILRERFGMTVITAPQRFQIDGIDYEVDVVGHAGDRSDEVYLVEIKSQLREEGIHQILEHLRRFPRAFPEHRGKKLFGILAAVTLPVNLRSQALREGLYLATIKDDVFELMTPDDFEPRPFGLRGLHPVGDGWASRLSVLAPQSSGRSPGGAIFTIFG